MANNGKRLVRWIPAIVLMVAIFLISGTPAAEIPKFDIWDTVIKKGGHMLGYGMLAVSYAWALYPSRKMTWLVLLFVVIYAASDEIHQTYVAGRHGSVLDVLIDCAGAAIGMWFWSCFRRKYLQRSNPLKLD